MNKIDDHVKLHGKDPFFAFLFALVFGALGLMYVSIMAGLMLITFGVLINLLVWNSDLIFAEQLYVSGITGVASWLFCVIAAPFMALRMNNELRENFNG